MKKKRSDILKRLLQETKKGLALTALAVTGFFVAGTQKTWAMEMPTEEQIEEYKEDGSLQERIDYCNDLTEDYSQGLIADKLQEENVDSRSYYPESFGYKGRMPTEGEAGIILVRVDFQDMTFREEDSEDTLREIAFGDADEESPYYPYESLAAYYKRASYGKLQISGDVYSYTAKHERAYYEDRINELYEETLDALDESGVDFSRYDKDGDGYLDGVYLHFAGENTGWGSIWWSATYMNSLEEKEYDGKKIGYHAKLTDGEDDENSRRTLIHETGHMLGLPDYYSYTEQTFDNGIKTYDMMCDNIGDFNAFSKWLLGWLDEDEILQVSLDEGAKVEQKAVLSSLSSMMKEKNTYKAAVVSMEKNGIFSEYYLVEYDTEQENQSWLRFNLEKLPEGFRVFHVNAELNEMQTGFKYSNNIKGETKLIELVDPDFSEIHSDGGTSWEQERLVSVVPGSMESEKYRCYYLAGDSLTPDTKPSTVLDDERYYGKSGISFHEFEPDGEMGSVKITVEPIKPFNPSELEVTVADVWKEVQQSNRIIVPLELSEPAELNENADAPYLKKKDGTKVEGAIYSYTKTKYLVCINTDEMEEGTYDLILPEEMFQFGEEIYSLEESVKITDGKNVKHETDISITPGSLYVWGTMKNGGWCRAGTEEEGQLQLTEISKEGKVSEKTIDITDWENWDSCTAGSYKELLQLPDGSWVISEDEYTNERTLVAHIGTEGKLSGEILEIPERNVDLHLIGNTVKAVAKNQYNHVSRMWNLDFNGEIQEVPVEHAESNYFFFDQGYLIEHMDGDPVGYSEEETSVQQAIAIDYDWMDEKDQKVTGYQFDTGNEDEKLKTISQYTALEKDGNLYLIGPGEYMPEETWESGLDTYEYITLYLYQIDEKSGKMIKKTKVKEPIRYIQSFGLDVTPKDVAFGWSGDKIVCRITSNYSTAGYLSDIYLLNTDGSIEERISNDTEDKPVLSGQQVLLSRYEENGKEYKIYSLADSSEPKDPEKPDDPSEPTKPSDPKKDQKGKNQEKTTATDKASGSEKVKALKTGDQNHIPLVAAGMAAGAGLAGGVLIYRKKKAD